MNAGGSLMGYYSCAYNTLLYYPLAMNMTHWAEACTEKKGQFAVIMIYIKVNIAVQFSSTTASKITNESNQHSS